MIPKMRVTRPHLSTYRVHQYWYLAKCAKAEERIVCPGLYSIDSLYVLLLAEIRKVPGRGVMAALPHISSMLRDRCCYLDLLPIGLPFELWNLHLR
jgi:hypothetical protein